MIKLRNNQIENTAKNGMATSRLVFISLLNPGCMKMNKIKKILVTNKSSINSRAHSENAGLFANLFLYVVLEPVKV